MSSVFESQAGPGRRQPLDALLPERRTFADRPSDAELAALPACAAVYLLEAGDGASVLLAHTQNLRRLAQSRFSQPLPDESPAPRADLAEIVRAIRWREVDSRFEADWRYWRCVTQLSPREADKLAPFGPASYLRLDLGEAIPHPEVSERVCRASGAFIGPFPSRSAANAAHEGIVDLFDLCRYPEQVRRAPRGERCAYAEMGRCDAPCDGASSIADYRRRVEDAWRFASGGVADWIAEAEQRMRSLAGALQFEKAALLKTQLEFARRWSRSFFGARLVAARPTVLLIPVVRRRAWKPFYFLDGALLDGPRIAERKLAAELTLWLERAGASAAQALAETDPDMRMRQHWLVAGFLQHPRSQEAIIFDPGATDAAQQVAAAVAAKRGRMGSSLSHAPDKHSPER